MRNILGFALTSFKSDDKRHLICSAIGPAVSKCISCAEILKRKYKTLHQITKIRSIKFDEVWEPKSQPELDKLKITREIPSIHILLSKDPLHPEEPGYQPPGKNSALWLNNLPVKQAEKAKAPPKKNKAKKVKKEQPVTKESNKTET